MERRSLRLASESLLDDLYDAAAGEFGLGRVLERLAEGVAASGAALVRTDIRSLASLPIAFSRNYEKTVAAYDEVRDAANPMFRRALQRPALGQAVYDDELMSRRELRRTPYYNEFLRPVGIEYTVGLFLTADDSMVANISMGRPRSSGTFRPGDRRLISELIPHLQRIMRLRSMMRAARASLEATYGLLEQLPWGVWLLDGRLSCLHMNAAARRMIAQRDGLDWRDARLVCGRPADTESLNRSLQRSTDSPLVTAGSAADVVLHVARPSGKLGYVLRVIPVTGSSIAEMSGRPAVVIVASDPMREPALSETYLRQALGLTAAEARVAIEIARGATLKECSDRLGCSRNTTKTLLKRVFAKTETRRQSDLVGVILRSLIDH